MITTSVTISTNNKQHHKKPQTSTSPYETREEETHYLSANPRQETEGAREGKPSQHV